MEFILQAVFSLAEARQPTDLPAANSLLSPANHCLCVWLRFFEADQVPGARYLHDLGARDLLTEDLSIHRRDEPILLAPHHQRRRLHPPQPPFEPTFRDREEELGDRAEAPRHADQRFDLLLRAIIFRA